MDKKIIDISVSINEKLPVWPGSPGAEIKTLMKIGPESVANVSHISIESHTGTHIDAPLHFIKDGHTTAEIALSTLIGSCQVVYIPHVKSIGPDELKKIPFEKGIKRILFKTDNQHLWDKEEYNFEENKKRLKDYSKVVDASFLKGEWDPAKASKLSKTMFELDGKKYTQKEFTAYLNSQQRNAGKSETYEQEVYKLYTNWVNAEILAYEDANLENKYPEFKILVNEYRDGILLFDLTEEKVWSKASKDSAGLPDRSDITPITNGNWTFFSAP